MQDARIDAADVQGTSVLALKSQQCIERLSQHTPEVSDLPPVRPNKLAAVLVLLYEVAGELRVLLTTRSKSLRSHPGQTALPGGRVDPTDVDHAATAFREANEEVGLPLNHPGIRVLCHLRPFLSAYRLLVTPVVAFLADPTMLEDLRPSPAEVDHIFSHPFEAMLDPQLVDQADLVEKGSEHWPYTEQLYNTNDVRIDWLGGSMYRMHRFRSSASPVKGLTADILITAARIAYDREPTIEQYPAGQSTGMEFIRRVLEEYAELAKEEGKDLINGNTKERVAVLESGTPIRSQTPV